MKSTIVMHVRAFLRLDTIKDLQMCVFGTQQSCNIFIEYIVILSNNNNNNGLLTAFSIEFYGVIHFYISYEIKCVLLHSHTRVCVVRIYIGIAAKMFPAAKMIPTAKVIDLCRKNDTHAIRRKSEPEKY